MPSDLLLSEIEADPGGQTTPTLSSGPSRHAWVPRPLDPSPRSMSSR